MNHAALVAFDSDRLYQNRNYILAEIDIRHFDALNQDDHVSSLNGYCLDALDYIPCGSTASYGARARDWAQTTMPRGWTLEQRLEAERLAVKLIAEIMKEWE